MLLENLTGAVEVMHKDKVVSGVLSDPDQRVDGVNKTIEPSLSR